jgi:anti-sigma B factor antagonist
MRVQSQKYNNVTVIEMQGELDLESVEQFKSAISDAISERAGAETVGIVLDMNNIGFIDSSGLGQLLWARDYCNDNCCAFRIAGLSEQCTKVLEVTRLDSQFERYPELAEAVKSCT